MNQIIGDPNFDKKLEKDHGAVKRIHIFCTYFERCNCNS